MNERRRLAEKTLSNLRSPRYVSILQYLQITIQVARFTKKMVYDPTVDVEEGSQYQYNAGTLYSTGTGTGITVPIQCRGLVFKATYCILHPTTGLQYSVQCTQYQGYTVAG